MKKKILTKPQYIMPKIWLTIFFILVGLFCHFLDQKVGIILVFIFATIVIYDDIFDLISYYIFNKKEYDADDYYLYKFLVLCIIIFCLYTILETGFIPQTLKLYLPLVSLFLAPQLREYITNFREAVKEDSTQKPEENQQPSGDQASERNDQQDPPKP